MRKPRDEIKMKKGRAAADKGKRPAPDSKQQPPAKRAAPAGDEAGPSNASAGGGCQHLTRYSRVDLTRKTLKDLQAILKELKLPVSGKKDDLITRILDKKDLE